MEKTHQNLIKIFAIFQWLLISARFTYIIEKCKNFSAINIAEKSFPRERKNVEWKRVQEKREKRRGKRRKEWKREGKKRKTNKLHLLHLNFTK